MEAAVTKVATAASMWRNQKTVEKLLNNYSFNHPILLAEALTHSSYLSTGRTYERLEFIGDAALGLAVSDYFYRTNSQIDPGCLTSLRSANVSTKKLARVAVQHNLYPLLLHSCPGLDGIVEKFTLAIKEEEGGGVVDSPVPKVLADLVEAIIGAVYVDCDFDLKEMWNHVKGILEPIVTDHTCNNCVVNSNVSEKEKEGKKLLNEFCSRKRLLKPEYRVEPEGPAHERRYKCSVHVQTSSLSLVESGDLKSTVKHAENNAAYKMYLRLALEEGLLWKVEEDKRKKTNLLPFLLLLLLILVLSFGREEGK